MSAIDEIKETFALLDDWDDRYRYLIDLGRSLEPLPAEAHNETNKVRGCASQVWIETTITESGGEKALVLRGDSDAHLVKGLIAVVFALYSGRPARQIRAEEASVLFKQFGLDSHLTPQRSNGVRSMVDRIDRDARNALSPA